MTFVPSSPLPPSKPDNYWLIERQRTAYFGTKSRDYGQPWIGTPMENPPDRDKSETVDELREQIDDVLQRSREQLSVTTEFRQAIRDIHVRMMTGGFPLLPRREGEGK